MTPLVSDAAKVHPVAPLGERPRPHNLGMRTSAICQIDAPRPDTLSARDARVARARDAPKSRYARATLASRACSLWRHPAQCRVASVALILTIPYFYLLSKVSVLAQALDSPNL